jgi:DNA-binding response OmpR family regulator
MPSTHPRLDDPADLRRTVHISNLRQKVERDPQDPELIVTVRGVGYKFDGGAG